MECFTFDNNHGLDHVALCVRSLSEAQKDFEHLGFQVFPGGRHEEYGTQSSGARFSNDTYLELLTSLDPSNARWLIDFLERHEGALFFVLKVPSVQEVSSLLRHRGFAVGDPVPGTWRQGDDPRSEVLWRSLFLPKSSLPGKLFFFIEYTPYEQLLRNNPSHPVHFASHPNGSRKLRSIWIAVEDVMRAAKEFEAMGFFVGPTEKLERINAQKRVIEVGRGRLELIQPLVGNNSLDRFLQDRGEGIFGFSIEIEEFSKTKRQLSKDTLKMTECHDNAKYLVLSPAATHGAWIELRQME